MSTFVHLRLHSEFSITDGMVRISDKPRDHEAVRYAKSLNMPALGISDLMGLFGMVKHYKACRDVGIKPIIGVDCWIENKSDPHQPFRCLLIVKNRMGYERLCTLVSKAFRIHRHRGHAEIKKEWIAAAPNTGLICLSGAHGGEIGLALLNHDMALARKMTQWWSQQFPDHFYLELQRTGQPECEVSLNGHLDLAEAFELPVVATHPIQFMQREDFQAHEVRVCIAEGTLISDQRRPKRFTEEQYFKSSEEMQALFADIPEALINTVEIGRRCNFTLDLGQNYLPLFPTPDGSALDDFLVIEARRGLADRLAFLYPDPSVLEKQRPTYEARLQFECETIIKMGFAGYFLIVADFINWGRHHGCPVGPGRGSGVGSLVSYALKITDLDPLRYALLFERFLNPERVSMPDFDVDFCQENRWRVIEYVKEKYGEEAVTQIATFNTLSSKAVVRDVGRVLDLPFRLCDRLSKLIPLEANRPVSLAKAIQLEPQIQALIDEEEATGWVELSKKLEDLTRGVGMHAGGVLIAPGKITDFCPIYQASGEDTVPVSMLDKDDVEQIGLIKFDFLGLRNITIIQLAQKYIQTLTGETIDVSSLPLDDAETYRLFAKGNTTAVFQFESVGMKKMLVEARPGQFEEIIAFVSLYRPGPMDLIPDFIRRMHGEAFEYLHPLLQSVLAPTYGIMVYQEQVIQAAQVCGGYTAGGADLLRRAMGKKKKEDMLAQRTTFVGGARKKGIDEAKANEIFDYMEKFAGYAFNKSHAAAYALIAYRTAWLKAHHTAAYMAATMSTELNNTDQLKILYDDCIRLNGLKFLAPDINHSVYRFIPVSCHEIRYALGAIKGVGESAVEAIVAERTANGLFKDLYDFCRRVDRKSVNRRAIESLIRGGAFDTLQTHRAALLAQVEQAMQLAESQARHANQASLFEPIEPTVAIHLEKIDLVPWSKKQTLAEEKTAIGFYLSGHPFEAYAKHIQHCVKTRLDQLQVQAETQIIAGIVSGVRIKNSERGKIAFVLLDDGYAKQEVSIFAELIDTCQAKLKEDELLVIECKMSENRFHSGQVRVVAERVYTAMEARNRFARALVLRLNQSQADMTQLHDLLFPWRSGPCPVEIEYQNASAYCRLSLGEKWQVVLHDDLLASLSMWLTEEAISIDYYK